MIKEIYWNLICLIFKKRFICFFFFTLFTANKTTAQKKESIETNSFYKIISFGEKIDLGYIDASAKWIIDNNQDKSSTVVIGNDINDYLFQNPGEYEISFEETKKHDEKCHHPIFPEKFCIKVAPVKLSFDFSKISFSQKPQKSLNTDIIITVPVKVLTKDSLLKKLPVPKVTVSGIGISLTVVSIQNEIILNNNIQLLKYKLSGTIDKETYLMFDFYDFNNQVQTYNFPQKIK